jgi:hypothetical protein
LSAIIISIIIQYNIHIVSATIIYDSSEGNGNVRLIDDTLLLILNKGHAEKEGVANDLD